MPINPVGRRRLGVDADARVPTAHTRARATRPTRETNEDDDEDDEDARARARGDDARRTPKRGVEDDAVDIARIRSVATTRDRERRDAGRDVGGERARGVESVSES